MANQANNKGFLQDKITFINIIFFAFTVFYFYWVLSTYRNIVHMDIMNILSTKVKDFYEHNLTAKDFFYQPLFPGTISISFTFLNSYFFHLNTVLEVVCGAFCLMILGYKYLSEINNSIEGKRFKIAFAIVISFLIYGFHKWEAVFTSCFSFAVFFNLCICFFNYFFVFNYVAEPSRIKKDGRIVFFILSNLLVIFEAPAYFYAYMVSIILVLFLVRRYKVIELNIKRWRLIFGCSTFLLIFTIGLTTYLSKNPAYVRYASSVSLSGFIEFFLKNPFWIIKFYFIAHSGAYLGEAKDYIDARALFGFIIFISYLLAIYYGVRYKDRRMLVPIALIIYNIISCAFITMSRYVFNAIEYGASSRYTAFNLSGVLGLATILFFLITDPERQVKKYISMSLLAIILCGYLFVDRIQWKISPARTAAFKQFKTALLTGENLEILQADKDVSRRAIEVLKKYKLNVYYEKSGDVNLANLNLKQVKSVAFVPGTPAFDKLERSGFYDYENGITWTNGKASIFFDQLIETGDSVVIEMDAYMPEVCKNVVPKLSFFDSSKKEHLPIRSDRKGDNFYFFFTGLGNADIQKIKITSDTINAYPDQRTLSFPFKSIEIKDGGL